MKIRKIDAETMTINKKNCDVKHQRQRLNDADDTILAAVVAVIITEMMKI